MFKLLREYQFSPASLSEAGLLLISFTLPIWMQVNSAAIIFCLGSIFVFERSIFRKQNNYDQVHIIFALYFLLLSVGFMYSVNKSELFVIQERNLSLVVFPIIFLFKNIKKEYPRIVCSYVLGVFFACIISFSISIYNGIVFYKDFEVLNFNLFYYHDLASNIGNHASYFSVQIGLAILFIIDKILRTQKTTLFQIIMMVVFLVFLLLLKSTVGSVGLLISLTVYFYLNKKRISESVFMSNRIIVGFCIVLFLIGFFVVNLKLKHTNLNFDFQQLENWNNYSARFAKWICTVDVIKANWLFGTGTGDWESQLLKSYADHNFIIGIKYKFNPHNQWLHTAMMLGIFGLLLLILMFKRLFVISLKYKDFVMVSFLVMILQLSFVESFLHVQKGIVFFTFFALVFTQKNSTDDQN